MKLTRLMTDHHHLILEYFCQRTNLWKNLATSEYETLSLESLIQWLKSFPKLRKSKFSLELAADLFEFIPVCKGSFEEIKRDVLHHRAADEILLDVLFDQAIILEQASISIYQEACKVCKIKISKITPQGIEANLLPWRETEARRKQLRQRLQLLAFPVFSLIFCLGWSHRETIKLETLKAQNQSLNRHLHLLMPSQSAYSIESSLRMLESFKLMHNPIDEIQIQNGEVNLSGYTEAAEQLPSMLDDLKANMAFKADSLHDWSLQQTRQGNFWQASFKLAGPEL